MALRKALSYSKKKTRPFTRKSRDKAKAYIKTIPFSKVTKFNSGNQKDFDSGKHKYSVKLIAEGKVLIRDNALESCRTLVNKILEAEAPGQFFMAIKVYPHHFLRENKSAGGVAGADRISTGMTQSFGVVIGRAAIVAPGKDIVFVSCLDERCAQIARRALVAIKAKVPGSTRIVFEKVDNKLKQGV